MEYCDYSKFFFFFVCVSCNYGISKYFLSLQEFHEIGVGSIRDYLQILLAPLILGVSLAPTVSIIF